MTDLYVEVRPDIADSGDLAGGPAVPELLRNRIDELSGALVEVAQKLRARLDRELSERSRSGWELDEVSLSFSVDLKSEAGVVVARASARAGFHVSLSWRAASDPAS
jgi:hypothetical protein